MAWTTGSVSASRIVPGAASGTPTTNFVTSASITGAKEMSKNDGTLCPNEGWPSYHLANEKPLDFYAPPMDFLHQSTCRHRIWFVCLLHINTSSLSWSELNDSCPCSERHYTYAVHCKRKYSNICTRCSLSTHRTGAPQTVPQWCENISAPRRFRELIINSNI